MMAFVKFSHIIEKNTNNIAINSKTTITPPRLWCWHKHTSSGKIIIMFMLNFVFVKSWADNMSDMCFM